MATGIGSIIDIVNTQVQRNQSNSFDSLALISKKLIERMNEERRDVAIDFTRPDLVRADREKTRLMEFKAKAADELSAVTKAKGAISWVSSKLNTMLADLQNLLGSSDPTARAEAAATFDAALSFINSQVDGASQKIGYRSVNLVGNTTAPDYTVDDLYIRTNEKGGRAMVEGAYFGSNYHVEDADGYIWSYSSKDNAYIQRTNDDAKTATGNTVSADGLTVDSYDHDTGAVTFGGSGSLSGTVVRGGIDVLDSKFYGDFADDTGVQNAIDDLIAATNYVSSEGSKIKADASLLQSTTKRVQDRIATLSKEVDRIKDEELSETAARTKAARLKMSLAVNNINLVAQHNTALIQNILNLTEGIGPAPGVFSSLGY